MATMDIFEGDAFSIIELTRALENIPFKPAILSGASLFGSRGVRSTPGRHVPRPRVQHAHVMQRDRVADQGGGHAPRPRVRRAQHLRAH